MSKKFSLVSFFVPVIAMRDDLKRILSICLSLMMPNILGIINVKLFTHALWEYMYMNLKAHTLTEQKTSLQYTK